MRSFQQSLLTSRQRFRHSIFARSADLLSVSGADEPHDICIARDAVRPRRRSLMSPQPLAFTLDAIRAYLAEVFPQAGLGRAFEIEAIGPMRACVRLIYGPSHLRPGGTISGPSMFALADVAFYVAVLTQLGPVGLAVTTNMNINFLRKPAPRDLVAGTR